MVLATHPLWEPQASALWALGPGLLAGYLIYRLADVIVCSVCDWFSSLHSPSTIQGKKLQPGSDDEQQQREGSIAADENSPLKRDQP